MTHPFARLRCWWLGHRNASIAHGCPDCGTPCPEYEHMIRYFEGASGWLHDRWERFYGSWCEWWHCPVCGGRFGRHDENQEHLPF